MTEALTPAVRGEADAITRRMGENYRDSVEYYRELARSRFHLTPKEQCDQTLESADRLRHPDDFLLKRVAETPLKAIDWHDLETVENAQAGKAWELWTQIKEAAREELQSGQRAVEAISSTKDNPFDQARYLVLREELAAVWQPKNGIETAMLDQMAQAQQMYLYWLNITHIYSTFQYKGISKQNEKFEAPRLSEVESLDNALNMTDRFQKMFLRTARALQNMRRFAPVTIVQNNGGQVNVGAQQVNVAPTVEPAREVGAA